MTTTTTAGLTYGATQRGGEAEFRLWAPRAREVTLRLLRDPHLPLRLGSGQAPPGRCGAPCAFPMRREGEVFTARLPARAGDRYFYILDDGRPLPDPVSRLLPEGVHGPTEVVDPDAFPWSDQGWRGLDLRGYILYELHVGTFTPPGTFEGVIERLDYLKSLGISVIELMPVAAFPGTRNWGYDGASPYAVQASYGGPEGLKRLVDAAHGAGLAVVLDVVYNHLGPEGNYLSQFAPYFTGRHHTPWGDAINYDGPDAREVRRYFVDNALYWIREYHLDGLRLDAVQTICDESPKHIVQEIAESVHALARDLGRRVTVIAETDENDARYFRPIERGGYGVDAVWSDDFHHALHTLLTREREGYYQDFGRPQQLVRALNEGFAFQGEPFGFWDGRPRGTPAPDVLLYRHVICTQNHDQVGNRARGERLTELVPRGARQMAAALLLLAPHTPLLFMGQEYEEGAPFQYFTDHGDPALQRAVSEGRRKEFAQFTWDQVPDPQEVSTFERSKLKWPVVSGQWSGMLGWYRQLIDLRRRLVMPGERTCRAEWRDGTLIMQVPAAEPRVMLIASFPNTGRMKAPSDWQPMMSSDEDEYHVVVYESAADLNQSAIDNRRSTM